MPQPSSYLCTTSSSPSAPQSRSNVSSGGTPHRSCVVSVPSTGRRLATEIPVLAFNSYSPCVTLLSGSLTPRRLTNILSSSVTANPFVFPPAIGGSATFQRASFPLEAMNQIVGNKFPGRGLQRIVHQTEILRDILILRGISLHEGLQIGAALPAKLKECFDAIVGNRGRIG